MLLQLGQCIGSTVIEISSSTMIWDSVPLDSVPLDSVPLDSVPLDSAGFDILLYGPRRIDGFNFISYHVPLTNPCKRSFLLCVCLWSVVLKGLWKDRAIFLNSKKIFHRSCCSLSTIQSIALLSNFILCEYHTFLCYGGNISSLSLNYFKSFMIFHSITPCSKIVDFNP